MKDEPPLVWTLDVAVALCRAIEEFAPRYGCHVALTGGVLYKNGPRKDLDLLFYRIRQVEQIDVGGLFKRMAEIGVKRVTEGEPWCIKAITRKGFGVDCFFPEASGGSYGALNTDVPAEGGASW